MSIIKSESGRGSRSYRFRQPTVRYSEPSVRRHGHKDIDDSIVLVENNRIVSIAFTALSTGVGARSRRMLRNLVWRINEVSSRGALPGGREVNSAP
jgi:hypothetical protein